MKALITSLWKLCSGETSSLLSRLELLSLQLSAEHACISICLFNCRFLPVRTNLRKVKQVIKHCLTVLKYYRVFLFCKTFCWLPWLMFVRVAAGSSQCFRVYTCCGFAACGMWVVAERWNIWHLNERRCPKGALWAGLFSQRAFVAFHTLCTLYLPVCFLFIYLPNQCLWLCF